MFIIVFFVFLVQFTSSSCTPSCVNKDCVQVGEETFSCLARGSATLSPATDRRALQLCEGCDFHSIVKVQTPSGTLIKKQQSYLGIPIVGSHVIELQKEDEIVHIKGNILDVGEDLQDTTPTQDLDLLLAPYRCEELESELAITFVNFKAHLIYDVKCWTDLADENSVGHMWNIEFDAQDGSILSIFDGVDAVSSNHRLLGSYESYSAVSGAGNVFDAIGGNERAGEYQHQFQLVRNGDDCTYDSEHVYVANNQGSSTQRNEEPWTFPCSLLPEQNDAVNGANSPLNDAFAFGLTFWNLYQEWYDMPPLNEKLGLVVHYGEGNAMWDGRKMYFSDGDSRYHPYVSVDVVAHEVSHGTTQHNSNLVYRDQSGGINEAFSDMAGATAEFFYFGTTEFEMGNKIRKQSGAMRYMCDPERDGRSIGHVEDYRQGMDVHHSSGVFNKVFCALSNKAGWDPRKAFHVFLVANRVYWDRNTNFVEGANDAIQSSVDLGYGSNDICGAFSQVGIVGSGCDGNLTPAPVTTSTTTTSTRRPQSSTNSPNDTGDCVDEFSSCNLVVRVGHCPRMREACARTCGYCSESTTSDPRTTSGEPSELTTAAPITTSKSITTPEIRTSTSDEPNEPSTSQVPEGMKAIMIISGIPYSCDIHHVSQTPGSSLMFQQGSCVEYNLS